MSTQVVIPEDPSYEDEYEALKDYLFRKYKKEIPAEFTKVCSEPHSLMSALCQSSHCL